MTAASATASPEPTTTIFTEITALAERTGAINLGQGFPDTDGPRPMLDAAHAALDRGHNQYPPLAGLPALRTEIAAQRARRYGTEYDPADEVLVTVGATEAITSAVLGLCGPGDEVIIIEPFYDSYRAAVRLAGATRRTVGLHPVDGSFGLDLDELAAAVGPRTRMLLLNSPHNPTGRVFSDIELRAIARLCREHDVLLVADEVYEYLTFDDTRHRSIAELPDLRDRILVASSAGKTFNVTGWKVGWLCGPAHLLRQVRAVKQYLTFAGGAPLQHAVAVALGECEEWAEQSRGRLQRSRDVLLGGLRDAGCEVYAPQGGYFLNVDVRRFGYTDGIDMCRQLPTAAGVAGIPFSAFFDGPERDSQLVRFAFCKRPEIITEATRRLHDLALAGTGRQQGERS